MSRLAPALFALLLASPAKAGVSISLTGSSEISNSGLERLRSNSITANVSMGLGDHFMVGLTHRRSFDNKIGLKKQANSETQTYDYLPFEDDAESVTSSIDLTVIPYNGLISPLIFGGLGKREYYDEFTYLGTKNISRYTMFPVINYGFGLVIQLGMGMQLKLTQTYTPGAQTTLEDGEEITRPVKDSYTQVWLGYRL